MLQDLSYTRALVEGWPGASWSMTDEDYNQLVWHSEDIEKPTLLEVEAKLEEVRQLEPMKRLRDERDQRLKDSDWSQGTDVPDAIKTAYQTYRQALRDLPETATGIYVDDASDGGVGGVNWPTKP